MLFVSLCESYDFVRAQRVGQASLDSRIPRRTPFLIYSLSYLKCCLTYCACRQAWNPSSVQAGEKPVRSLFCFWSLNKTSSILIFLTWHSVLTLLPAGRVNMLLNSHMGLFIGKQKRKKNSKFIINNQKNIILRIPPYVQPKHNP